MKGRKPNKAEREYMARVVEIGCIVCRNEGKHTPPQIHHVNGRTKEGCHMEILPLCYYHHQEGNNDSAYVSRHPFKKEFEKRYGTEEELMKQVAELAGK